MTTAADFDKKYDIIDAPTPEKTWMSGKYKRSFAYYTLRERLPITLTAILDNLSQDRDELIAMYGEEAREETKNVIGLLSKLKYQLQTDKPLEELSGNEPDKQLWNEFINKLPSDTNSFFRTCWLYAECYMYRKISSFFENTESLKTFDYFAKQKKNAKVISTQSMEVVATSTRNIEKSAIMFMHLLKLNLWGNTCDLSITSGKEVKPDSNPFTSVDTLNANLLVNQTLEIWNCISALNQGESPVIVDIICDNAGYELYTDFVLAEYIIDKGLADKVRFNVKAIPWFISDVTPTDFQWSLQYLSEHSSAALSEVGKKWTQLLITGKFELAPIEYFWTSPYEFYRMAEIKPDLYQKLSLSKLVIFKGDLNYRKLIGDYTWDFTENFTTCLRGFQPTNLCALRTVKADLICGLNAGQAENLSEIKKNWMTTGEYGVIQFSAKQNTT